MYGESPTTKKGNETTTAAKKKDKQKKMGKTTEISDNLAVKYATSFYYVIITDVKRYRHGPHPEEEHSL